MTKKLKYLLLLIGVAHVAHVGSNSSPRKGLDAKSGLFGGLIGAASAGALSFVTYVKLLREPKKKPDADPGKGSTKGDPQNPTRRAPTNGNAPTNGGAGQGGGDAPGVAATPVPPVASIPQAEIDNRLKVLKASQREPVVSLIKSLMDKASSEEIKKMMNNDAIKDAEITEWASKLGLEESAIKARMDQEKRKDDYSCMQLRLNVLLGMTGKSEPGAQAPTAGPAAGSEAPTATSTAAGPAVRPAPAGDEKLITETEIEECIKKMPEEFKELFHNCIKDLTNHYCISPEKIRKAMQNNDDIEDSEIEELAKANGHGNNVQDLLDMRTDYKISKGFNNIMIRLTILNKVTPLKQAAPNAECFEGQPHGGMRCGPTFEYAGATCDQEREAHFRTESPFEGMPVDPFDERAGAAHESACHPGFQASHPPEKRSAMRTKGSSQADFCHSRRFA